MEIHVLLKIIMTKHEKVNYSSFATLFLYFNLRSQIHKNDQTPNLQYKKERTAIV